MNEIELNLYIILEYKPRKSASVEQLQCPFTSD